MAFSSTSYFKLLVMLSFVIITPEKAFTLINEKEHLSLFPSFLRALSDYTRASAIHFITNNSSDMDILKSMFNDIVNWTMIRVYRYTDHRALEEDLDRYETKSIIAIIYSSDSDFVTSIIKQMTMENKFLNRISLLIKKPNNSRQLIAVEVPPSFRLFTFDFSKIKNSSKIDLGFFYTNYKSEYKKTVHKYITSMTKDRQMGIGIPFSRCCYDIRGYGINVVYFKNNEPMVTVNQTGENIWKLSGILGDVFSIIFKILGVRLNKVYPEANGIYGGFDEFNKTVGLFKELHEKSADLALAGVSETHDRRKIADFTEGILPFEMTGIYKEHAVKKSLWSFYCRPFSNYSWILISLSTLAMLFVATVSLKILKFEMRNTSLDIWGAILGQGTYGETSILSTARSCYYIIALILGILLSLFYSSKLIADKTVTLDQVRFNSLEEVAKDEIYSPLVHKYSSIYSILQKSEEGEFAQVWNKIKSDIDKHSFTDEESMYQKLRMDHAVLLRPRTYLKYYKSLDKDLRIIEKGYLKGSVFVALQKHSPLTRIINNIIIELKEDGVISHILRRHEKYQPENMDYSPPEEITFSEFLPLLFTIILGILLSLISLGFENARSAH